MSVLLKKFIIMKQRKNTRIIHGAILISHQTVIVVSSQGQAVIISLLITRCFMFSHINPYVKPLKTIKQ